MLNLVLSSPFYPHPTSSWVSSTLHSMNMFTKNMPFDMESMMGIQQKNLQAMSEAQEATLQGLQIITRRQTEMMSRALENQSFLLSLLMQAGTPEEKIMRHAETAGKQYKSAIQDIRSIQDLMSQTIRNATDILHQRTLSTLSESQRQMNKDALVPANSEGASERRIAA